MLYAAGGRVLHGHMSPSEADTVGSATPFVQIHEYTSSSFPEGTQGHAVCVEVVDVKKVERLLVTEAVDRGLRN